MTVLRRYTFNTTAYASNLHRVLCAGIGSVCLVLAVAGAGAPLRVASDESPTEYEVKAALLFKFVSFVEWPSESFPEVDTPIRIGILGEDPFGEILDRTIKGKTIRNRTVEAKRATSLEELTSCHIVFIAQSDTSNTAAITATLHKHHILTVGDSPGFAIKGGVINLIEQDGKIGFEINAKSAQQAHIHISSQLMSLANVVEPEEKEEQVRDQAPA